MNTKITVSDEDRKELEYLKRHSAPSNDDELMAFMLLLTKWAVDEIREGRRIGSMPHYMHSKDDFKEIGLPVDAAAGYVLTYTPPANFVKPPQAE